MNLACLVKMHDGGSFVKISSSSCQHLSNAALKTCLCQIYQPGRAFLLSSSTIKAHRRTTNEKRHGSKITVNTRISWQILPLTDLHRLSLFSLKRVFSLWTLPPGGANSINLSFRRMKIKREAEPREYLRLNFQQTNLFGLHCINVITTQKENFCN